MIQFRSLNEKDMSLVYDSFKKTMFEHYKYKLSQEVDEQLTGIKSGFMSDKCRELEMLMQKSEALIVCDPEDAEFIFGYVIYKKIDDALIIHFAYMKNPFRKCGLMRKVIREHFKVPKGEPIFITYKSPYPKFRAMMIGHDLIFKPEYRSI